MIIGHDLHICGAAIVEGHNGMALRIDASCLECLQMEPFLVSSPREGRALITAAMLGVAELWPHTVGRLDLSMTSSVMRLPPQGR